MVVRRKTFECGNVIMFSILVAFIAFVLGIKPYLRKWLVPPQAHVEMLKRYTVPRSAAEEDEKDWFMAGTAVSSSGILSLTPGVADYTGVIWHRQPLQVLNFEVTVQLTVTGSYWSSPHMLKHGFVFWLVNENAAAVQGPIMARCAQLHSWTKPLKEAGFTFFGYRPNFKGLGVVFRNQQDMGNAKPGKKSESNSTSYISVIIGDGQTEHQAWEKSPSFGNGTGKLLMEYRTGAAIEMRLRFRPGHVNVVVQGNTLIDLDVKLNPKVYIGMSTRSGEPTKTYENYIGMSTQSGGKYPRGDSIRIDSLSVKDMENGNLDTWSQMLSDNLDQVLYGVCAIVLILILLYRWCSLLNLRIPKFSMSVLGLTMLKLLGRIPTAIKQQFVQKGKLQEVQELLRKEDEEHHGKKSKAKGMTAKKAQQPKSKVNKKEPISSSASSEQKEDLREDNPDTAKQESNPTVAVASTKQPKSQRPPDCSKPSDKMRELQAECKQLQKDKEIMQAQARKLIESQGKHKECLAQVQEDVDKLQQDLLVAEQAAQFANIAVEVLEQRGKKRRQQIQQLEANDREVTEKMEAEDKAHAAELERLRELVELTKAQQKAQEEAPECKRCEVAEQRREGLQSALDFFTKGGSPPAGAKPSREFLPSRRRFRCVPHFCIFQGDDCGFKGWSRQHGSRRKRWDTLLDALLKCLMLDGSWKEDICASLFVGADALHLTGAVQRLVMPVVGIKDDGRPLYSAATVKAWEEAIWGNYKKDHGPNMQWQVSEENYATREHVKEALLRKLDQLLEQHSKNAVALVLDVKASMTWEQLKSYGAGSQTTLGKVFFLLGGAHGFDGKDDQDPGFTEAIFNCFRKWLGKHRVAHISLCEEPVDNLKFTTAQTAAFLRVECERGTMKSVVAGFERVLNTWQTASKWCK